MILQGCETCEVTGTDLSDHVGHLVIAAEAPDGPWALDELQAALVKHFAIRRRINDYRHNGTLA